MQKNPVQRRKTARKRRKNGEEAKANLPALTVGEVFQKTVEDVMAMQPEIGFRGVVDVGITFNTAVIHSSGFLGAVFGGEQQQSSTKVQLATRVHLDSTESESE